MSKNPFYFSQNVAQIYDAARPDYPDEIYEIIAQNLPENQRNNLLEVGAGNGAASVQILTKLQPKRLVLLEPGENFVEILGAKFANQSNVEIVEQTFEDYQIDEKFDAIFAATAWHWLNAEKKYAHAAELLNPNGMLIIFRNYYDLADENVKIKIDELYEKYDQKIAPENLHQKQLKRIVAARDEIRASSRFEIVCDATIEWTKMVDVETYIDLRKSFQDNAEFGERFFDEMRAIILADDDEIKEKVLTDLIIARRTT